MRFQHKLIRMDQTLLAIGGITNNNLTFKEIKIFDEASEKWTVDGRGLKSEDIADLVVLPFPTSSLDCVPETCECGVSKSRSRIFGGTDADVRTE